MAMGPVDSAVLTGVIVSAGRWSQGKSLSMRTFIGAGTFAVFLAVINANDQDLASKFALLVLVAAAFAYGPDIAEKLGLLDKSKPTSTAGSAGLLPFAGSR